MSLEPFRQLLAQSKDLQISLLIIAGIALIGVLVNSLLFSILQRFGRKRGVPITDTAVKYLKRPSRFLIPTVLVISLAPSLKLPPAFAGVFLHVMTLLFLGLLAWFAIEAVRMLRDHLRSRYDVGTRDNLLARKVFTQIQVAERVVITLILIMTISAMLMTFDAVKQVGVSILASAGIIGIIVGVAAQRTIATLFAGIQIAITQPIRLEDVVIVEGEWGWIEEITLTYVVVRVWDLRRLVLPITYFIEHPFQNWTRNASELLGTVFIYADYKLPVARLREELRRILESAPLWDKKVCTLVVTDATEKTMQIRALVSAEDSSSAFLLRCHVREKLIEYVQNNFPDSLPRTRIALEREGELSAA